MRYFISFLFILWVRHAPHGTINDIKSYTYNNYCTVWDCPEKLLNKAEKEATKKGLTLYQYFKREGLIR